MDVSRFDYNLPKELIAQFPSRKREQSRLMVVDRRNSGYRHLKFGRITDFLRPGDALVVNNTKVFKARLHGKRPTGGAAEIFLVRRVESESAETWLALARPSRKLKPGDRVSFDDGRYLTMLEDCHNGQWKVGFTSRSARDRIISKWGHVPLPQYIRRDDQPSDIRRYQTVFASKTRVGAVAAPTAGFHFSKPILDAIRKQGVTVHEITLHVGPGTFKPITVDDIHEHTVDPEFAELSAETAAALNQTRFNGGRVFAVGTTSVRTLESADIESGQIQPLSRMVDLYIKPGHRFQVVDRLITNFHLPKSSLLVLVAAFAGLDRVVDAYAEAVQERYRFYSYGDAMLIL